jgi:uncharacterized protein (TIGR00299 family) protein
MSGARLHFDCWSGLAGDMFLGACLDLGLPFELLEDAVARLQLDGVTLERREAQRGGIRGIRFRVLLDGRPVEGPDPEEVGKGDRAASARSTVQHHHHDHEGHAEPSDREHGNREHTVRGQPAREHADHEHADHEHVDHEHVDHGHADHDHAQHRPLSEIRRLLAQSALAPSVRDRSLALFARLAEAEARIHRVPIDDVHFHELGAVDAIVDLVGAATAWDHFAPESASCGPINVGGGQARTAHGMLPVPAPATAELLRGLPIYGAGESELVTPTGAVLLAELVDAATGELPRLVVDGVGYGLGKRDPPGRPNAFRLLRGRQPLGEGEVLALECTVDDVAGESLGYLMERLLEGPAIDVFFVAAQMKKNRPGTLITVLCRRPELEAAAELLLRETGAMGCRWYPVGRFEAERAVFTVTTEYGDVRVKEGRFHGRPLAITPEYEDCRRVARERRVPLSEVYRAAVAAARAAARS